MAHSQLLRTLRQELVKLADPDKAIQMRRYMKSAMPFHGVPSPLVKQLCRDLFPGFPPANAEQWRAEALSIWREAKFREERYAAIEYTRTRQAKAFQDRKALAVYEEFIVTGAWWDYVDIVASHHIGELLKIDQAAISKKMLVWSRSSDMWKRRSAILCQLTFKGETDLDLLYRCIEESMSSKEFFLRKAIGWALRQYARVDAKEVIRYVKLHKEKLSPLSKREALKAILKAEQTKLAGELSKLL